MNVNSDSWEMPALAKAREVSRKSLENLKQLREQYPEDLPADVVERVGAQDDGCVTSDA
jgi:hypothetical protein